MEDTFKVRIDKVFGSLQTSSSSTQSNSSSLSSLWCLTDEEIERNKWIQDKVDRHKDDDEQIHRLNNPKPYSPVLQGLTAETSNSNLNIESDIQELDDEEEDEDENRKPELTKPVDHSNEEWDIRSSIGMDCTLDNEEEEDAYDKVAVGNEESANQFYTKHVNDFEVEIDSTNELPNSFTDVIRDPRANHMAAKLRLKEDEDSARKLGLQISANNNINVSNQTATRSKEPLVMSEIPESKVATFLPHVSPSVPDHVLNPSKYTHYTFDSKDGVDEESNRKAYMEFFGSLKGSAAMEIQDDVSTDSARPIIFTPKKKSGDVSMKHSKLDGHEDKKVVPISIAEGEVCMMDEDEPEIAPRKSSSLQKSGRRYRTKGDIGSE
ncbi:hypothetical protein SSX86_016078 [Deinandra increscens subsp. villosa]|uniref:U5 small nuclear ribonucleoprotein TSSC4 n=1 Tax=Deinandra increscens subsp. villosa TaxID=3103831 RepID=A0AAP0GWT9_9ASTR